MLYHPDSVCHIAVNILKDCIHVHTEIENKIPHFPFEFS